MMIPQDQQSQARLKEQAECDKMAMQFLDRINRRYPQKTDDELSDVVVNTFGVALGEVVARYVAIGDVEMAASICNGIVSHMQLAAGNARPAPLPTGGE